jgi:Trk K+ transport system NAD-binding subunit
MPSTSSLDRVTMVVLRYLRKPFFAIVIVYAVGIIGMSLIPGQNAEGNTEYMNLFHSFYFFTYTATTTGFGELPHEFTDEQRLWAIFCLYTGAFTWFYAIGSTIRLLQNPHFIQAVNERGFARLVKGISEPFYVICGFGDTGSLLARGLSDHHHAAVVLDRDPDRIKALALRDYSATMPGLCADASVPKHLVDAGIRSANCKAVVILLKDEDSVLKIAVVARFLNPDIRIICRATDERHKQHLEELDGVTVVDPFEIFAQLISMAVTNPPLHNLNSWFVRAREVELGNPLSIPAGKWVICGFGRMGQWLDEYMRKDGLETTVIDPRATPDGEDKHVLAEYADRHALEEADVENAAGVIASTDDDSDNLSILLHTRALNPDAFSIVRQNAHENQLGFDAARADLTLQESLTTARRVLKFLISPLVQDVIDHLRSQPIVATEALSGRLHAALGSRAPHLWSVRISAEDAPAVRETLARGRDVMLADLVKDPRRADTDLPCVPLALDRHGQRIMLPENGQCIVAGDEILFCGTEGSEWLLAATLRNPYTLHYLVTGKELPRGYFFAWLYRITGRTASRDRGGGPTTTEQ